MKTAFFLTEEQKNCIILALENEINTNGDWIASNEMETDETIAWEETIAEQKEIVKLLKENWVEERGKASWEKLAQLGEETTLTIQELEKKIKVVKEL